MSLCVVCARCPSTAVQQKGAEPPEALISFRTIVLVLHSVLGQALALAFGRQR